MKADIEWIEKLDGRVKRTARLTFMGRDKIKWQTKRSDEEFWDYDTPPTEADWDHLIEKLESLYNRHRMPFAKLELIRRLRKEAESQ